MNCLSPEQVIDFTNHFRALALIMPQGIHEGALRIMLDGDAVRDVLVSVEVGHPHRRR
ncbi:hypothetical protein [Pseudomonas syringae]|uniref:hypothetical protein n=1 Tax=Pseudomonas syringae TaxID=317 RepID=UPI000B2B2886|nr:hypothetical protein [Pseudomonas syringae]